MEHKQLVKRAKEAIQKVFDDMSVSQQATRESLEELRDQIGLMLEALAE